jgi:lipid A 3-O-deacylase
MRFRFCQEGIKAVTFLSALVFISIACHGEAQDLVTGVRAGISLPGAPSFHQVEAYGDWKLPWRWDIYSGWIFRPYAEISAGWLSGQGTDGFVGTLGPALELYKGKFPVVLEGGSSGTLISRDEYGNNNFGYRFQFTSHIGFRWDITRQWSVGWRVQHMSNAGIAKPNPGLNMQMISASYTF